MKLGELLSFISKVADNIGASKPYIVGGIPRDKALNKLVEINDIDITNGDETIHYLAKEVNILLNRKLKANFKAGANGNHSIVLGNLKLDFSSNFNFTNIDENLKKIGILNPTSMQKEVYSRDFTINTLLMDLDLKTIHDPTGQAFKDLNDKVIKSFFSPEIYLEKHNFIIRAIYLAAKLDFEIDSNIINFVRKNHENLNLATIATSAKYLAEKLSESMKYNSEKTLDLLKEMHLNKYIPIAQKLRESHAKT